MFKLLFFYDVLYFPGQKSPPNLDKECWNSCGGKGGNCDSFCGKDAACCRLGWKNDPPECVSGCDGHHCCALKEHRIGERRRIIVRKI